MASVKTPVVVDGVLHLRSTYQHGAGQWFNLCTCGWESGPDSTGQCGNKWTTHYREVIAAGTTVTEHFRSCPHCDWTGKFANVQAWEAHYRSHVKVTDIVSISGFIEEHPDGRRLVRCGTCMTVRGRDEIPEEVTLGEWLDRHRESETHRAWIGKTNPAREAKVRSLRRAAQAQREQAKRDKPI